MSTRVAEKNNRKKPRKNNFNRKEQIINVNWKKQDLTEKDK